MSRCPGTSSRGKGQEPLQDNSARLAAAIDAAMSYQHVPPKELARRVGAHVNSVRRWRRGETVPGTADLQAIAAALDAPGDLFMRPPTTRAEAMAMMLAHDDARAGGRRADDPPAVSSEPTPAGNGHDATREWALGTSAEAPRTDPAPARRPARRRTDR